MDFWGQVWKRVWKMAFFGLKLGLDLEMRAAHPHQKFQGVPPGYYINDPWNNVKVLGLLKVYPHLLGNYLTIKLINVLLLTLNLS